MARLADIEVGLELDMSGFQRDLGRAQRDINNVGKDLNRTTKEMNKSFNQTFKDMGSGLGGLNSRFQRFSSGSIKAMTLTAEEMAELPDHLKPLARQLNLVTASTSANFDEMTGTLESVQRQFKKATVSLNDFGKAGTSVKESLDVLKDVERLAKRAKFAMIGLDESGKVEISTEEANKRIEEFTQATFKARQYMEDLDDAGDFETARAGLQYLQQEANEVNGVMQSLANGGRGLSKHFQNLGYVTQDASDAMVIAMERYKDRFLMNNDLMMAKSTKAQDIMKMTDGITYYALSNELLKLGDSLERRAREGTALNLALKRVGKDAPFSKILDETRKIQTNISRLPVLIMGMGIATGVVTYGLIELSNHVDGRLIPAFEDFKKTWADALTPFVEAFTTAGVAVIDFGTWIGSLAKRFAEVHPQLSQMVWGFLYLTMVFTLLLAPLAVGIGLTGGLAAGFTLLWTSIAPFVLAFLTVVGVAMLVAGAVVILIAVFNNMWKASENLRSVVSDTWQGIKDAVMKAIEPLFAKWDQMKTAFSDLVSSVTGGEATKMGDFWKWLGDMMAVAITQVSEILAPLFKTALDGMVKALGFLMDMAILAMEAIAWAMPYILPIIKDTWESIKSLIKGGVDVILGIVKFFKAMFTGDWKGMWEAVKQILSGAWKVIWNYFLLFAGGKVLGIFGKMASGIIKKFVSMGKGAVSKVKSMAETVYLKFLYMKDKVDGAVAKVLSSVTNKFSSMKAGIVKFVSGAVKGAVDKFNSMKSSLSQKAGDILSTVTGKFRSIGEKILSPIKTAKDKVLGIVEKIKSAFNNMKISLPKFSLPKVSIGSKSKTIMGKEFSVPTFDVKWNAKGAIFDSATVLGGGQGVGEAGSEAIIPIEHSRYMKPFSSSIAKHLDAYNKGNDEPSTVTYQINMNGLTVREEADVQRIVDEMERRRKIQERTRGVVNFG